MSDGHYTCSDCFHYEDRKCYAFAYIDGHSESTEPDDPECDYFWNKEDVKGANPSERQEKRC